jgi:putative hydrolase of the HAD superfamily
MRQSGSEVEEWGTSRLPGGIAAIEPRDEVRLFENRNQGSIKMSVNGQEKLTNLKAVIFDYGDVLCIPPTPKDIEGSAQILGIGSDLFWALWHRHRDPYDRGDLSPETYWSRVAEDAGRSINSSQVRELAARDVAMWSRLNPRMLEWREDVSAAGMKTAVLSNMHAEMVHYARRNFLWVDRLSWATFSAEVRLIKPEPAIYEHCLQGLGVASSESLFIDDREVNLAAARAIGIHGIQYKSIAQLRNDLEAAGFLTLPPDAAVRNAPLT